MYNNQSFSELIEKRKSIRIYKETSVEKEKIDEIKNFIKNIETPFDKYFRIELFDLQEEIVGEDFGSYGMIKGAKLYIGIAVKKEPFAYENLGFVFEKLVLFVTSLGLGTCWFGGNLKGSSFEKAMNLKEEEIFPIMTPIGYGMDAYTLTEKIVKFAIGSNKRKDFAKLFFEDNFKKSLKMDKENPIVEALEMLRLAPSAINFQPWRVLKINNTYHFYVVNPKKKNDNFYIQRIDMGIGLAHFIMTLEEKNIKGQFVDTKPNIKSEFDYVISWKEI